MALVKKKKILCHSAALPRVLINGFHCTAHYSIIKLMQLFQLAVDFIQACLLLKSSTEVSVR